MNDQEKQKLLSDLEQGRQALLDSLKDVTEDLAARAPAPGSWSVLECVEHLAVSENYLFDQMMASHLAETPMVNEKREAMIGAVGLDRNRKMQSPDVGMPSGRFSTLGAALNHFQATRERTVQFVNASHEDLRRRITSHPILGTVNCYEMLLMIAVHPFRHAKQIEEIRATLH